MSNSTVHYLLPIFGIFRRNIQATSKTKVKVAVAGACGSTGQMLSLLIKQHSYVSHLSLYDNAPTLGIATDLSHIDTPAKVKGFTGPETLKDALKNADIIMIITDVAKSPAILSEDLFNMNASIARDVARVAAEVTPKALIAIAANPVNSLVPIVSEVFKKAGVYDAARIFGVCTCDVVRANTYVADIKGLNPNDVHVPVIGGHSGVTTVPVISQSKPTIAMSQEEFKILTKRIQEADKDTVKGKAETGFGTMSTAYAATRFCFSLIRALAGEENVVECAYIRSDVTEAKYFSNPIILGKNGVKQNLGLGTLTSYEQELLKIAVPELKKNIKKGEDFIDK